MIYQLIHAHCMIDDILCVIYSLGDSRLGVQDESIPLQRKRERSSGSRGDTNDISVDESMRKRRSLV